MIYDFDAETCKQCTMKHLSTALTVVDDSEMPEMLRRVYFCGNLSHAANHLVHLSEQLAEDVRGLRIDAQDDGLNFKMDVSAIKERLLVIINDVSEIKTQPPEPPEQPKTASSAATPPPKNSGISSNTTAPVQKRGCPCKARQ